MNGAKRRAGFVSPAGISIAASDSCRPRLPYPHATDLIAEAIRIARARQPRDQITATRWQAGTSEVREWAAANGFHIGTDGSIPGQAMSAYNQTHPDRPY